MKQELEYLWYILGSLLIAITNMFPHGRMRRAISAIFAIILVIVVIVAGVAIIYIIVVLPGTSPTTTIYP